jgi:hypothetical protein
MFTYDLAFFDDLPAGSPSTEGEKLIELLLRCGPWSDFNHVMVWLGDVNLVFRMGFIDAWNALSEAYFSALLHQMLAHHASFPRNLPMNDCLDQYQALFGSLTAEELKSIIIFFAHDGEMDSLVRAKFPASVSEHRVCLFCCGTAADVFRLKYGDGSLASAFGR